MASQNEKSLLSQVTLDTSKINKHSLSTSILPPLHTGQTSYIAYKHKVSSRHQSRPLPFGSTSSRVTEQLQPKISSHIVSYSSSQSHFKPYNEHLTSPFGSSENRFKEVPNRTPGPGLYHSEDISSIKSNNGSWKFSKMDRDLSNHKNVDNSVGPGSYQVDQSSKALKFRQKIAQKYRQQRKKYVQLLSHPSNRPQPEKSFTFTDQKASKPTLSHESNKANIKTQVHKQTPIINRFVLKDSTKKYVLKEKENTNHFCDNFSAINKNFTYNFVEKADNAFASYIPKTNDSPGPGYYTQKPHQLSPVSESFAFKSSSVRALFPSPKVLAKKQKTKLSQLL